MTSTLPGQQVPDVTTVLKRVDDRLARRAGDDPLPAETITEFGRAVQTQIVEPLVAGAVAPAAGPDPAIAAELDQLRSTLDDYRRSTEMSSAQYRKHVEQIQTLAAERDTLLGKLDDSDNLGVAWAEALAETAEQRAALWELLKAAVRDRRQAWAHAAEIEQALDERSRVDGERHRHAYPVPSPGELPQPCACGQPYPRTRLAEPREDVAPDPEPWADIFAGLRSDLADWNPKGHAT